MDWVIIGLGNVGRQYEFSRHNIGFEVVDLLAARHNLSFVPGKGDFFQATSQSSIPVKPVVGLGVFGWLSQIFGGKSSVSEETTTEDAVLSFAGTLLKPTTLMNRSGNATRQALDLFSVTPQQLIVVIDDFHLPLGKLRLRKSGSDGGHNGLRSIISALGTDNFPRLRVGIGPKPTQSDIVEFVLGQFDDSEKTLKKSAVDRAADACDFILSSTSEGPSRNLQDSENLLDIAAAKYNIGA
jgi:peptidyl-tRNA hydrolase, PTH1 family